MKNISFLVFCIGSLLPGSSSWACSVFILPDPTHRTISYAFDWYQNSGYLVTNPPGLEKTSLIDDDLLGKESPLTWVSKYGSYSFVQFGFGFPMTGINARQLTVENLRNEDGLNETFSPSSGKVGYLNSYQLIQYLLDNAGDLQEALNLVEKVHVVHVLHKSSHVLVCDAKLDCAVIEYLEGKMVVHRGSDWKIHVLANNSYAKSLSEFQKDQAALPPALNRDPRFVFEALQLEKYEKQMPRPDPVQYGLETLARARYRNSDGSILPSWHISYDLTGNRIVFSVLDSTAHQEGLRQVIPLNWEQFNTLKCRQYVIQKWPLIPGTIGSSTPWTDTDQSGQVDQSIVWKNSYIRNVTQLVKQMNPHCTSRDVVETNFPN